MEAKKKPTLSDVMNAIITSVSRGRQAADFEAMRSAMTYQKIELLKGIPVPRMRINNVKVSIPMILNAVTPATVSEHAPILQISTTAAAIFEKEVKISLDWMESGMELLNIDSAKKNIQLEFLRDFSEIFQQINDLKDNSYTKFQRDFEQRLLFDLNMYKLSMNGVLSEQGLQDVVGTSAEASLLLIIKNEIFKWIKVKVENKESVVFDMDRAENSIEEKCKDKIVQGLLRKIKFTVEGNCISVSGQSSELEILVDTESIKNAGGGPDTVTRLSFVIREEGLEWITEVNEDKSTTSSLSTE
jgi:hypothetical protein